MTMNAHLQFYLTVFACLIGEQIYSMQSRTEKTQFEASYPFLLHLEVIKFGFINIK